MTVTELPPESDPVAFSHARVDVFQIMFLANGIPSESTWRKFQSSVELSKPEQADPGLFTSTLLDMVPYWRGSRWIGHRELRLCHPQNLYKAECVYAHPVISPGPHLVLPDHYGPKGMEEELILAEN